MELKGENRKGVKGSLKAQVKLDTPGHVILWAEWQRESQRGTLWADFKGSGHPSKEFGHRKPGKVGAVNRM